MGYDNGLLLRELPWARRFARVCTSKLPTHLDHEDLQSAGVIAYVRAAQRYDVKKGTTFRAFCSVRIRGAVLDELRRWDWAPRSVHRENRRLNRVTSCLVEQLEREPTPAELAQALGVDQAELISCQTWARPRQVVSFDEAAENGHGEENLGLADRVADPGALHPGEAMISEEDRRLVRKCLTDLPKTQATVLVLHYLQNVPLRDIATILAVTPSRVSQLHHQALGRLRQALRRHQQIN